MSNGSGQNISTTITIHTCNYNATVANNASSNTSGNFGQSSTIAVQTSDDNPAFKILKGGSGIALVTLALQPEGPGEAGAATIEAVTLITASLVWSAYEIAQGVTAIYEFAAEHTSNKTKSNWNKHSETRSGGDTKNGRYGRNRNNNRGGKNKKFIPKPNPNTRSND